MILNFQEEENERTNTLPWASFNFINSILGSGVIGTHIFNELLLVKDRTIKAQDLNYAPFRLS